MKAFSIFFFLQLFAFISQAQITHVTFNPPINVCSTDNAGPSQTGTYIIDTTIFLDIDSNGIFDLYFDLQTIGAGVFYHNKQAMLSVIPLNSNEVAVTSPNSVFAEVFDSVDFFFQELIGQAILQFFVMILEIL